MCTDSAVSTHVAAVARELKLTDADVAGAAHRIVNLVMRDQQEQLIEAQFWVCCLNCHHWTSGPNDLCSKYNAVPPAKVLVVGCPEWMSRVPF